MYVDAYISQTHLHILWQERKVFSDSIFTLLDMDKDGKITPADVAVRTRTLCVVC